MKRLEKGCFCMELNKAAALIGRLGITGSIFQLINLHRIASASEYNTSEYTISVASGVISLFINACLLYGAKNNNKCLTLTWIIWNIFGIITFNVVAVFELEEGDEPVLLCVLLISNIFWAYIIACIVSFYISLGEQVDSESIPYNEFSNNLTAKNVENV